MGKQSRRKRERRPSGQLRDAMIAVAAEDMIEAWPDVDWAAIKEITKGWGTLYGSTEDDPRVIPLLYPKLTDQMEFDRRVCEAGLTDFIRTTMPEDRGVGCTPIDPDTGKPDPSITRPLIDIGPYLRVRQAASGIRLKQSWKVSMIA